MRLGERGPTGQFGFLILAIGGFLRPLVHLQENRRVAGRQLTGAAQRGERLRQWRLNLNSPIAQEPGCPRRQNMADRVVRLGLEQRMDSGGKLLRRKRRLLGQIRVLWALLVVLPVEPIEPHDRQIAEDEGIMGNQLVELQQHFVRLRRFPVLRQANGLFLEPGDFRQILSGK